MNLVNRDYPDTLLLKKRRHNSCRGNSLDRLRVAIMERFWLKSRNAERRSVGSELSTSRATAGRWRGGVRHGPPHVLATFLVRPQEPQSLGAQKLGI